MGHWFFTNGKLENGKRKTRRKRTISLPCDGAEAEDDDDSDVIRDDERDRGSSEGGSEGGSLSRLVSKHFSATADVRAFNINMPQSQ